jgi:RHS repeat-associated protein
MKGSASSSMTAYLLTLGRSTWKHFVMGAVASCLAGVSPLMGSCNCSGKVTVTAQGGLSDFTVACTTSGVEVTPSVPAAQITVKSKPEMGLAFALDATVPSGHVEGCYVLTVGFDCGYEYQITDENGVPKGWQKGTSFGVMIIDGALVPSGFRLRPSKGDTEDSDEDGGSSWNPGGGGPVQGLEPWVDTSGPEPMVQPAGVTISVPLGLVGIGSGGGAPYRSAGVLYWGGQLLRGLAEPTNASYQGPEELAGNPVATMWAPVIPASVTYGVVSGYAEEKHLVTPNRLFRVTGYDTAPGTVVDFDDASHTYVREYLRGGPSESTATTLANAPVSWWKIEGIEDGVKVTQSIHGTESTQVYESPDPNYLVVNNGVSTMTTVLDLPELEDEEAPVIFSVEVTESRSGEVVSRTNTTYEQILGTFRVIEVKVSDLAESEPVQLCTKHEYYPEGSGDLEGKPWWISRPDGSWEIFEYPSGALPVRYTPFESEAVLNPSHADINTLPLATGAGRIRFHENVSGEVFEYVGNVVSGQFSNGVLIRYHEQDMPMDLTNLSTDLIPDGLPLISYPRSIIYGPIDNSSAYRWLSGKPILTFSEEMGAAHPPKAKGTYHTYSKDNVSGQVTITQTTGVAEYGGSGTEVVDDFVFHEIPNLSERSITVYGDDGLVSREKQYHTGSGFTSGGVELIHYDADGRYEKTTCEGVEIHTIERPGPRTIVEKDSSGRVTRRSYDLDGALIWSELAAGGGVPAIRTSYERTGLSTTTRLNGFVTSVTKVDGLGRVTEQQNENGIWTSTSYPNGGRTTLTKLPGHTVGTPLTVREDRHFDGSLESLTGEGQVAKYYGATPVAGGLSAGGLERTESIGYAVNAAQRFTRTFHDTRGRVARVRKPSPTGSGNLISQDYIYVGRRLVAIESQELESDLDFIQDLPSRLLHRSKFVPISGETLAEVYGGERYQGMDYNPNGDLEFWTPASPEDSGDRFTKTETAYVLDGGLPYRRSRVHRYPDPSGANPLTSETLESVGFVEIGDDSYQTIVKQTEPSGRSMTSTTLVTPESATVVTVENDSATPATTDVETTAVNGYVQTVEKAGASKTETYAYDSLGRVKSYIDFRGAATFSYHDNRFQLSQVVDQLRRVTEYAYYLPNEPNAGMLKTSTRPGGLVEQKSYNARGQLTGISGSGTYAQEYGYDVFGDRVTLTTFGTETAVTRWNYQPGTGLLAEKRYDFTGANQLGFLYEYTADGKLAKRTTGRGVETIYGYHEFSRDLTSVTYEEDGDLTPDIALSGLDGFGRPTVITETKSGTDAHVNKQTLSYHPYSGAVSTFYDSTDHRWLKGVKVEHEADDAHGRPAGFEVLLGSTVLSRQIYGYDDYSRLDSVDGRLSGGDTDSPHAEIGYLEGTDTPDTFRVKRGTTDIFERKITVDLLGRTVGVMNRAGSGTLSPVASVGHKYDVAGRRETAQREDGTWWDYDYNERSEVIGAVKKTAGNATVPGLEYAYEYDGIGNRESSTTGSGAGESERTYESNALNQYTKITHPGKFGILARSSSAVTASASGATVNGVDQEGNLYGVRLTASNSTSGKLVQTTLTRSSTNYGPVDTWVPPAVWEPTVIADAYDEDGNLINDGRWQYTWDGENRLVSMVPVGTAVSPGGAPTTQLRFAYDWMSRRIGKTVVVNPGGSATYSHVSYAYDYWNPVAEWQRSSLSGSMSGSALKHSQLWGPDHASSGKSTWGSRPNFQAGGGVGGLLLATYHDGANPKEHFVSSYDANGNIIAWTGGSGSLYRRMDYDSFGNIVFLEEIDLSVDSFKFPRFGFSTKAQDEGSGLYYYGYRYYSPSAGRWLSRDPLEENGGVNLYGFVENDGVDKFDILGLSVIEKCCNIWNRTKPIRSFNMSRNVIKLQIDQMEANIGEMRTQIAMSQLFQAGRDACEKARKRLEDQTGQSCNGCCITKVGAKMSRRGGQGWLGGHYGPSGNVVSIEWANGWFAPAPCDKTTSGIDYEESIYDSSWFIEYEEKIDM